MRTKMPLRELGLTMIELIMAIMIISISIVGILSVLRTTTQSSADPVLYKQAMAMADAILEEVMSKAYQNPVGGYTETNPQTCAGRLFYDDVSDYSCFDGSTSSKVIQSNTTLGGTASPLVGYTATVTVSTVTMNALPMKKVVVTVTGGGIVVSLDSYRSNL